MYDFRAFDFGSGRHALREDGMCVMEAVAYLGNEEHSDCPKCASPVIGKLAIWLNDSLDDKRRREWLSGLPYRLVGTAAAAEIEQQRAYMAADWAVRVVCPLLLERAGMTLEAQKLRDLPLIESESSARVASDAAATRWAVAAAAATRWAASDSAAVAVAAAAAARWAAVASDAAAAARWAVAAAAARWAAVASDAAAVAAVARWADLEFIQRSCLDLIDRMIRLTEIREVVPSCEMTTACDFAS